MSYSNTAGMKFAVESTNQYGFRIGTTHASASTAQFEQREREARGHKDVSVIDLVVRTEVAQL